MQKKQALIVPKSMQKDLAVSQFPNDSAYDIRNMRLITTGDRTSLCLTNEKSNKRVLSITGTVIGIQELKDSNSNETIVLFVTDRGDDINNKDGIYILTNTGSGLSLSPFYSGNLNFSSKSPIESIGIYETNNIQKVYWVDGINQPRVLNLKRKYENNKNTQFDFIPEIVNQNKSTEFDITIDYNTNAVFDGGVVQYAISYFNKHGQQTPIIYQSPLYYISDLGKGLNPDGSVKAASAFNVIVKNLNTNFDYCRIYRIIRTSINATPSVQYIGDFKTKESFYTKEYKASSLTNNISGDLSIAYGSDYFYPQTGDIRTIMPSGYSDKISIGNDLNSNYPCAIINPPSPPNDDESTNEPFYIKDKNDILYKIPSDKSVKITWSNHNDSRNLEDRYQITIADKNNPFGVSLDEYINGTKTYSGTSIYDTGTSGTQVDPTELLYLGGTELIAGTIAHKDNTLFLGNIDLKSSFIKDEDKTFIEKKSNLTYESLKLNNEDSKEYLNKQWNTNSNLLKSNKEITYFQKGETYRFGVQFMSKLGIWSEVIFLKDLENNIRVIPNRFNDGIKEKPIIKAVVPIPDDIKNKFIAARLVCVYPSIYDRNVLCQGIVCPTVYNLGDRNDNSPYVQSSWFARPSYSNYDEFSTAIMPSKDNANRNFHSGSPLEWRMVSTIKRAKSNDGSTFKEDILDGINVVYSKDRVIGLPSSKRFNGEFFGTNNSPQEQLKPADYTGDRNQVIKNFKNIFGVDKRILTLHSPELDNAFNDDIQNISMKGIKFRVVGYVPVKTTFSDININYESVFAPGYTGIYNSNVESLSSYNHISGYSLVNFPLWLDAVAKGNNEAIPTSKLAATFPIYPWHRKGSLSNQGKITSIENRKSILKSKTLSNLRICLPPKFIDNEYSIKISDVELWQNEEPNNTIKKINVKDIWGIDEDIVYRGNIDKVLTYEGDGKYDETTIRVQQAFSDSSNYKVRPDDCEFPADPNNRYRKISDALSPIKIYEVNLRSSDPIAMQYKSTGHAIFALAKHNDNKYEILPNITTNEYSNGENIEYPVNYVGTDYNSFTPLTWLSDKEINSYKGIYQKNIPVKDDVLNMSVDTDNKDYNRFGYYYIIGELYRDNVVNRFGGNFEYSKSNNTWFPCGDTVFFNNSNSVTLIGDQGDTFLGRYDHLKTYPLANDNLNNIVEIVSFCCETRVNVDGRYDKNRGNKNNLYVNPTNFNLFNKVYSQQNNFFNYRYLSKEDTYNTKFPSQIMWSKTKTLGEDIDTWVNINGTNILDLDGDKGKLNALRRFNNEIYSFQDSGISRIIFNPRVQINASDGIPIEISNSGKVEGKLYLTDKYGCQNKWSMSETPNGLYFVDDINQCILSFNGQNITDLTYTKNMYSWISNNTSTSIWSPKDYKAIRTLYDKNNDDVYFTTQEEALAFNEKLGAFSSFYDYNKVDWLFNIGDKSYQLRDSKIWELHGGNDYNVIFGDNKEYSFTTIVNSDFQFDKIFDTVEFRTNGIEQFTNWKTNSYPFNSLITTNEYQKATSTTDSLKKKFRTWRWQIGRNSSSIKFKRDRIRNPWAEIKMVGNRNDEVRLYDMVITYYV